MRASYVKRVKSGHVVTTEEAVKKVCFDAELPIAWEIAQSYFQRRAREQPNGVRYKNRRKKVITAFVRDRERYKGTKYNPQRTYMSLTTKFDPRLAAQGVQLSKSATQTLKSELADNYHKHLAEKTVPIVEKALEGKEPRLFCGWIDDYTRTWHNQHFSKVEDSVSYNYWTTCALKASPIEGARQPKHSNDKPLYEPLGYKYQTSMEILQVACPGRKSFMEDFLETTEVHLDGDLVDQENGVISLNNTRTRMRALHYDQASSADKHAAMKDSYLIDLLPQQYKSYLEFSRAVLRLISDPSVFKLVFAGHYLPLPLDWPAREFTEAVLLQGWPMENGEKKGTDRGPEFLGRLLHQCCKEDPEGNTLGNWDLWLKTCGIKKEDFMDDEDQFDKMAEKIAGLCARMLVPMTGPLHIFLNTVQDFGSHHRETLVAPLYKLWTGRNWPAKPKVRQLNCVLEVLWSGWVAIRGEALPLLNKFLEVHGSRFDVAYLIHSLEHLLPLTLMSYQFYLREGVTRTKDKNSDLKFFDAVKHICVNCCITQRKNYPSNLMGFLDLMRHWRETNHPMYEVYSRHMSFFNEDFGESGIHSFMRTLLLHQPENKKRREAFIRFAIRQRFYEHQKELDDFHNPLTDTPGKVKKLRDYDISQGRLVAAHFLNSMLNRCLKADEKDFPKRITDGNKHGHVTDHWTMPTITPTEKGKEPLTFAGYAVGAPGYALNPQMLGREQLDPENSKKDVCTNCGCGPSEQRPLKYRVCGHQVCDVCCDSEETPLSCLNCANPLIALMNAHGKHRQNWVLNKHLDPSKFKATKTKGPPKIIPQDVWQAGLSEHSVDAMIKKIVEANEVTYDGRINDDIREEDENDCFEIHGKEEDQGQDEEDQGTRGQQKLKLTSVENILASLSTLREGLRKHQEQESQ